ncbi:PadR family transcriptional regulator [soil metagenome]
MGEGSRQPEDFQPLTPAVLNILMSLAGGERHGYGIMREVREGTDGMIRLGPGTLYTAIKRLLEGGLIEEADERPDAEIDDQRRRYYRLTDFGQRVISAEVDRLESVVRKARSQGISPRPGTLPEGV